MRIVYLSQASALGGAERSLLDLMAAVRLSVPGSELHLLAGREGPLAEEAARLGFPWTCEPLPDALGGVGDSVLKQERGAGARFGVAARLAASLGAARNHAGRLSRAMRRLEPDLVHSNDLKSHMFASMTTPRSIPVVWHLRDFIGSRPILRHALRWVPRRPRACVAISNGVAEDARRALPWARVHAVLNCVDLDFFSPGPADPAWLDGLAGAPAPEGAVRIGLVATYAKWKGHEVYLRAAASLIHEGGPELFYLVGGPLYRTEGSQFTLEQLRTLADRLGASGKVRFVPFQQDVRRVYRALDVVVHASTEPEPFGRTIAEAMACGRAVIASPRGGSGELFRDGLDALAAEPGDPARLASRIREVARDPGRRESLARAARQTACDRFSRARLGRQIAEIYSTLAPERAGDLTRPA